MGDGMDFFVSHNGVILSEGFDGIIPKKYFEKVIDLRAVDSTEFKKHWGLRKTVQIDHIFRLYLQYNKIL